MKKFLLVLLLLSFVFSGCKNDNEINIQNGNSKDKAALNGLKDNSVSYLLAKELTTLNIATIENWYADAPLASNLPVWKEIEKRTNVRVQWEVIPWDQYTISMRTKLATAIDLPDILRVPGGDPTSYGQSGVLLPLEDLIVKHGPNIRKAFEKYPDAKRMMYSYDGHLYGLTPIIQESSSIMPLYWVIRKDWLDNLGLKMPDTLDDLHNVLLKFKNDDPNRNGKKDEIPWAGDIDVFAEAFGLHLTISGPIGDNGGFWATPEGKVIYQYIDPRYKEYLIYAKQMYEEGIISKDYGIITAAGTDLKVTKNLVGAMYMWPDYVISWTKRLRAANDPDARYVPFAPPAGPGGDRSIEAYGIVDDGYHSISKDCKNPELALRFLDYLWSDEGRRFMAWGIEGKSYVVKDGKPKYTDFVLNNEDGLGSSDALRSTGAWPTIPWIQQEDSYKQILSVNPDFNNCWSIIKPYIVNPFTKMLSTKEQNEQMSTSLVDIDDYVRKMTIRFIIGTEPIAGFDKYVEKIKSMDLDKILKVKQEQYDKLVGKK